MRVRIRDDLHLASVIARRGMAAALAEHAAAGFGLSLAEGPRRSVGPGGFAIGVGPARWLVGRSGIEAGWSSDLARDLEDLAAVADQSDGQVAFEVSGSRSRETLAKGFAVDLQPSAFGEDSAAVTSAAHIGAVIWREEDQFIVLVSRSNAGSFWHWLRESAAMYGLELAPSGAPH